MRRLYVYIVNESTLRFAWLYIMQPGINKYAEQV